MFDTINDMFLGKNLTFGRNFNMWAQQYSIGDELVNQVKAMGRSFLHDFLCRVRYRLQPYWELLMGLELANPCSRARVADGAWEGACDLMRRAGFDADKQHQTVKELKLQRRAANRWSMCEIHSCNSNLLRYYRQCAGIDSGSQVQSPYPNADLYARLVFLLHVASAVIETYFSKTKYIKSRGRMSMKDSTVEDVLHLAQTPPPSDVEMLPATAVSIDVTSAHEREENNIESLKSKYLHSKKKSCARASSMPSCGCTRCASFHFMLRMKMAMNKTSSCMRSAPSYLECLSESIQVR